LSHFNKAYKTFIPEEAEVHLGLDIEDSHLEQVDMDQPDNHLVLGDSHLVLVDSHLVLVDSHLVQVDNQVLLDSLLELEDSLPVVDSHPLEHMDLDNSWCQTCIKTEQSSKCICIKDEHTTLI
jgi:hypothetical protein